MLFDNSFSQAYYFSMLASLSVQVPIFKPVLKPIIKPIIKIVPLLLLMLLLPMLNGCGSGSAHTTEPDTNKVTSTLSVNLSVTNNQAQATQIYSEKIIIQGSEAGSLTLKKVSGPQWLSVVDGMLKGTPSTEDVGDNSITLSVSNGVLSKEINLTIAVVAYASEAERVINENIELVKWSFANNQRADLVSAAQVSGNYAAANNQQIEIRDIREKVLNLVTASDINSVIPEFELNVNANLCGMSLTPSGRMLFIALCAASNDETDKDAIIAFNTNTHQLSVFDRLTLTASHTQGASEVDNFQRQIAITYFKGQLYVGSDLGVYRYDATRNAVIERKLADSQVHDEQEVFIATDAAVTGLAVDMKSQQLYVSTNSAIYSRPIADTSELTPVYSGNNITALTVAHAYGAANNAELFWLERQTNKVALMKSELPLTENTIATYSEFTLDLVDISATADGKMMLANASIELMSDVSDQRLDFDAWLLDELNQYVGAIKSLVSSGEIAGTNSLAEIPEGFLTRKLVKATNSANTEPVADNVGWALYLLMAADQVRFDPDIEPIVELLIKRHAGLHQDGLGGVKTVDGHFVRHYESDGTPNKTNAQPQVYISMKFIPAVYKAAELYPNNAAIKHYKEYLRQTMKRASDTIRAEQRITWTNDDHGPIATNNGMSNETWIYGDLGAAQDPMATDDYANYVYSRTNMRYDHWLSGEPVIKASHSAFIIMGATMILRHHFEDPDWQQQNQNYYAITKAASDDLGAPYFAAFSAGNNPEKSGNYYNDGPSDHPGDFIHFPALLGLGQLGWTEPMVGGYQAYRDGLRQEMLNGTGGNNFSMLTRWAPNEPDYQLTSVGIADFWYGALGLVETIKPGVLDKLRDEFYLPNAFITQSALGNVELHYSKITPRRVIGIDNLGNETSLGFQLSPFELKQDQSFTRYKIEDPEGEFIELNDISSATPRFINPNFEQGLTGWNFSNNASTVAAINNELSIVGTSALITTSADTLASETRLSQTMQISTDLENTLYIARANGVLATNDSSGEAFQRFSWDADDNMNNGVLTTETSNVLTDINRQVEFETVLSKPAGANYLHISYVVQPNILEQQQYVFDNLSLVRIGAPSVIENGDFESGLTGWTESVSQIAITNDPDEVIEGNYSLKFSAGPGITGWKKLIKEIDVSNDPLGTRYIFHLNTKVVSMADSNFEIMFEPFDVNGQPVLQLNSDKALIRNDVGDITNTTGNLTRFTFRKRPNDGKYRITFRMKRNSSESTGTDEVIIDNLRLYKEQLF